MTLTARTLWLVLLFNIALACGVLAYGLGSIPFDELRKVLNWFGAGTLLSMMALAFVYMTGMNTPGDGPSLEDASPRVVRLIMGVIGCGFLALAVLVKGAVATVVLIAESASLS